MINSDHLYAIKVTADYGFTNGSSSRLNRLIIGSNSEEIFDTFIYSVFSSHTETYDDGVVWFKLFDAINKEKSHVAFNAHENCLFAFFVFDNNPLMIRSTSLYIDKICYLGRESDTTNKIVEYLEKFKILVVKSKECNKFKYLNEHEKTLEDSAIINLKELFKEHNNIDNEEPIQR